MADRLPRRVAVSLDDSHPAVPPDAPVYHILPDDPHEACAVLRAEIADRRANRTARLTATAGDYRDAIRAHGGFTVRNHIGDGPVAGYMVSLNKSTERTHPDDSFDDADVERYRQEHAAELAAENAYLGAWHHDGKVYLDVAHHFPDVESAMRAAREHDQLAIYDLGHGVEIATTPESVVAHLPRRPRVAWLAPDAVADSFRDALGLPPL